jgi:hypothetical protein
LVRQSVFQSNFLYQFPTTVVAKLNGGDNTFQKGGTMSGIHTKLKANLQRAFFTLFWETLPEL